MTISRRTALKGLSTVGSTLLIGARIEAADQDGGLTVSGRPVEVSVTPVGPSIVRISVVPTEGGRPLSIPPDGSLVPLEEGSASYRSTSPSGEHPSTVATRG